jgi:putative membrane protein
MNGTTVAACYANRQVKGGAMSNTKVAVVKRKPRKSLTRGLFAGLAGGLAGAVAMTLAERFLPHSPGTESASKTQPPEKAIATQTVRWGFGAAVGAAYGVVAEYYPSATSKEGVTFGMALEALAHEGALPALGFLVKPGTGAAPDGAAGLTSHVVYGVTTEVVRNFVRKRL